MYGDCCCCNERGTSCEERDKCQCQSLSPRPPLDFSSALCSIFGFSLSELLQLPLPEISKVIKRVTGVEMKGTRSRVEALVDQDYGSLYRLGEREYLDMYLDPLMLKVVKLYADCSDLPLNWVAMKRRMTMAAVDGKMI